MRILPPNMRAFAAPVASLGLIAGLWMDWRTFHLPVGDASAYHRAVRAVAQQVPDRIGDWVGTRIEPPRSAVSLLKPNLLEGREYKNSVTGESATLAVVQCSDARDMGGHWPPNCYPALGWMLRDSDQRTIPVGDLQLPVSVYRFTIESIDRYAEIIVYNFFLRPDGVLESGHAGVRQAAEDPRMKVFGAAQVQLSFGSSVAPDRRDEIFRTLVAGLRPVMDVVLGGTQR